MCRHVVTFVLGTRPEAIKMAPVIKEFKKDKQLITRVVLTGQHSEMVSDVFKLFQIHEDNNLHLMIKNQSLNYITSKVLEGLKEEFSRFRPSLTIVQGDTTSAFSAALASFYEKIPIAHIEAGLRTDDILNPFPEEANRRIISQIANLHFPPTESSRNNLLNASVTGKIKITGNTVIDAFLYIANSKKNNFIIPEIKNKIYLFVTIHRRENWGKPILEISEALKTLLHRNKDLFLVLPMHPNSTVRDPIKKILSNNKRAKLIEPLKYDQLVSVVMKSKLILTDSGGLQEEAPSLGKPVLILRNTTERGEAIKFGTAKLVGFDKDKIIKETEKLILDDNAYSKMSNALNPFGDGMASSRILKACKEFMQENNNS